MKRTTKTGQLRIIGGQWRGRKLAFSPEPGLRPTTDRVRETLFNWLAPVVHGARCVDLYAGSGALGLEALSRGAAFCDFVDSSRAALEQITAHLAALDATGRAGCHRETAASFLQRDVAQQPWDIAFIDPPFGANLIEPTCALLAQRNLLSAAALVYIESGAGEPTATLPTDWSLHREKTAGGVVYRLFVVGTGQIV